MRQLWFTNFTTYIEKTENVVNLQIHGVYDGETESTLILFSIEAWCHLSEYMNSQNYRSPSLTHKVPLTWHTEWHMVCWVQMELLGLFLLWGHKSTLSRNTHSDTIFWKLSNYNRIYACLLQDSAAAHTTNIPHIADRVFLVTKQPGPPNLPELNPCDFSLVGQHKR